MADPVPSTSAHEQVDKEGLNLIDDALEQSKKEPHPNNVSVSPGIPPVAFGAAGTMLKQFDESTHTSRKGSHPTTPPRSVVGIGGKVAKPDYSEAKIVVAMVGLPARGKSYLSNKLQRYLQWLEYNVKGTRDRDQLAQDSLEMLIQWLKEGGNVGIHDATNSTRERRKKIKDRVAQEKGIVVIFLESVCDDPAIIASNVALKVSSGDPDYKDMSPEDAKKDFIRRIKEYEAVYETITEPDLSYLTIMNVGNQVTLCHIHGYLQSRIAFYLMNLHLKPRSIYLSRHGESQYNVEGKIGGDSPLSERGLKYAKALPALVLDNIGDSPLTVWTSTLQRTIQTAQDLPYPKLTWKSLDELDAGVCDGMTYEEIEQAYPEDFANRDDDKFNYRYRGGESYRDVVIRLEPVIMELERQENILIIGHQAILRCLYAYFHNLPQSDLPYIKIPLHTVIKLTPKAYGCDEERGIDLRLDWCYHGIKAMICILSRKMLHSIVSLGGTASSIRVGKIGHGLMMMTWRTPPASDDEAFEAIKVGIDSLPSGVKMFLNSGSPSKEILSRKVDNILDKLRGTKKLDLFECARLVHGVAVEQTVRTLADFVAQGKFDHIGLSECPAHMARRANANFNHNLALVEALNGIAKQKNITTAQLCIAWVASRGPKVVPIPGSSNPIRHLDNLGAGNVVLSKDELDAIDRAIANNTVKGERY
ncbi:hypothetical protein EWM64_g3836 [Hericium alpestre]|uniref:fructose-2,6-bisphosphate 2-phosphatase n=1 Tax=Hericium alpestre TaxID=135208 RepID=A0A4Y9ZZ98_9AGAM|nr:hypothetical protein EWM64_g3836 [Hericium alpestre]